MRAVFPGKPQATLQAYDSFSWKGKRIVVRNLPSYQAQISLTDMEVAIQVYVSGNALVVLKGPHHLVQTISHADDELLTAVAANEASGDIATCSRHAVHIYKVFDQDEGLLRWSVEHVVCPIGGDHDLSSLSWGQSKELLVAGTALTLFSTSSVPKQLWHKKLANPAKIAAFSHDAALIASAGWHDRLVKIWRRLFSAEDNERFDVAYLPHPATVVQLQWHRSSIEESHAYSFLITISADNKARAWISSNSHALQILELCVTLDLVECLQPREPLSSFQSLKRYVLILDNGEFALCLQNARKRKSASEKENHVLAHLIDVADRNLAVCIVFDDQGNMSAWGLQRKGSQAQESKYMLNLAHVEGFKLNFLPNILARDDYLQGSIVGGMDDSENLNFLVNFFDGRIEWLTCSVVKLFEPSPVVQRLSVQATWTSHAEPIEMLSTTIDSTAFVSKSLADEAIIWHRTKTEALGTVHRHSMLRLRNKVLHVRLINNGQHALLLSQNRLSLWETSTIAGSEIASSLFDIGVPLCLLLVEPSPINQDHLHVVTMSSDMKAVMWKVSFSPETFVAQLEVCDIITPAIHVHQSMIVPFESQHFALAVPSSFASARDIALSCDKHGTLSTWDIRAANESGPFQWGLTRSVETCVSNLTLINISSIHKAALVDSTRTHLMIWGMHDCQLEHEVRFEQYETVVSLCWQLTDMIHSILAVGLVHKVLLYAELPYDYLDSRPCWQQLRIISIADSTSMPIADLCFLAGGDLVVAAGQQLFLFGAETSISESIASELNSPMASGQILNMLDIVDALNGSLPIYHPELLLQCLAADRASVVDYVLNSLYTQLKFFSEGDELQGFLGIDPEVFNRRISPTVNGISEGETSHNHVSMEDDAVSVLTEDVANSLNEALAKIRLPYMSEKQQSHLMDLITCIGSVEKQRPSVDELGIRYLVFLNWQLRTGGHATQEIHPLWREINWAAQSTCQDILIDITSRFYQGRMLWRDARESGLFMWLSDIAALRSQFEVIARNEYTKSNDKNPVDCSLFYVALRKKQVLAGLWRMATWHQEQRATSRLLANNFDDPRWQTAALKNAYALLGRRRIEYAAVFFLLAGHLKDAVGVLCHQAGDLQLAVAVARVYEGNNGPVLRQLLEEKVLPEATRHGDKWCAAWAFEMLGRRSKTLQALTLPLSELTESKEQPNQKSKHYLSDDPALASWYEYVRGLRIEPRQKKATFQISPSAECKLVMHTVRLYNRMGCGILALDLVRNWTFSDRLQPVCSVIAASEGDKENGEIDTHEDLAPNQILNTSATEPETNTPVVETNTPRKKVVEEPSTSSILDNFEF